MELIAKTILGLLNEHKYIFAFLGATFEGTFIMILAGVFYRFGYFKFWGLIGVLSLGYFINGLFFYLIGRIGGHQILEKWGKKLHVTRKILEKLEEYFKKHSAKTLFITRVTWGLSIPTLIIAGSFKMKWKNFLIVFLIANFVWVFTLVGIGYVFGISYEAIGNIVRKIARGFIIALFMVLTAIIIFIIVWLRHFVRTKFVKNLENHRSPILRGVGRLINKLVNNKNEKNK